MHDRYSAGWHFTWLRSWDEIEDSVFLVEWQRLADESPDTLIWHEPVTAMTWLRTKGEAIRVRPAFCLASSSGGGKVLVPFCMCAHTWRNTWQRRVVPVGEPHFDYQNPLGVTNDGGSVDWSSFWPALEHEIRHNIQWFDLAVILRMTSQVAPANAGTDAAEVAPYIGLDSYRSFEEFLSGRSSNHRTDVRRRFRRLSELGEIELRVFSKEEQEPAVEELTRMVSAYEALWAGTPSVGLFRVPGTLSFYEQLIRELLPAGFLHFSVLHVSGAPISWHFGFLHRRILHWYKPTYLPEFSGYAPGKVHMSMLVKEGIARSWRRIDLGGGTEGYKFRWTDDALELRQVSWRTRTLRSKFCRAVRAVKACMRRRVDG